MQAAFYGVGAAVIGIIAISAYKLTVRNVGADKLLWAIYLVAAAVTVWTQSESIWLFLGAGVLVWLVRAPPKRWTGGNIAPALLSLGPHGTSSCALATGIDWTLLAQLGAFFAKAAAAAWRSFPFSMPASCTITRG
jgi:chromate transporter